jgi:FAD/FMN-containing dehydrogenase
LTRPATQTLPTQQLRRRFGDRLVTPDDEGYEAARTPLYGGIDLHPAAVIRVRDIDEIRRVIALAHETGLPLAVRGGGHSIAGHSLVEGGIVLELSPMKRLDIDPSSRTAWAEAGLTAVELSNQAQPHELAVGFGDTGSVGIGGITLGGGVGYLVRAHGLTVDSLLGAKLVTAAGEVLEVDADHHPDLFWAIRGGGGNFGVVTRFHYQLHPVGTVVGGMVLLPATAASVAGFIEAAEAAPEALSAIANVMPAPPMPGVPEEHLGKPVIFGLMVHVGDVDAGLRAVAPFRALATPIVDMLGPMPYPQIYPPEDPDYHPTAVNHTMFIDRVDLDVARTIVEYLEASDASLRVAQLRVLGGAMARIPADATAFAHRSSRIMVNVAAFYDGTPEDRARRARWVSEFAGALFQGDVAAYVNFLDDEGEARVRAAYPGPTWDRLVEVKRRYDPTNFFHRNQNIPPDARDT